MCGKYFKQRVLSIYFKTLATKKNLTLTHRDYTQDVYFDCITMIKYQT